MNLFSVKDKICCVTGAGRGIGHELAKALHQSGAIVIGLDLEYPEDENQMHCHLTINLTKETSPAIVFDLIQKTYGKLDVLLNCAGITLPHDGEYPIESWDKTFAINVDVPFKLTTALVPLLMKSSSPSVINITSLNASLAFPNNPAYVASKSALAGLTRSMSLDLGPRNIRVNAIAPGYIKTKMTGESWTNPEKRSQRAAHTVLNKWGTPQDLIGPALFLASDASSYVTGQSLFVDGGWSIKGL
tara:strand:+ start:7962 stop:8696 length:735 start_codon:yes stop_codon:yes gene_type:complete